jgi:Ca-activated chloride channel family protein
MNADDPKFTAHVLGEIEDLTSDERAEIEALLASDPAAAAEAAETRALAARLRAELAGEAAAALKEHQRAAVLEALRMPLATAKIIRFPRWTTVLSAIAACVVVGISIGLIYQALQMPAHVSVPPLATTSTPLNQLSDLAVDTARYHGGPLGLLVSDPVPQIPPHIATPEPAPVASGNFIRTGSLSMGNHAAPAVPNTTALTTVNTYTGSFMVTGGNISVMSSVTTVSTNASAFAVNNGGAVNGGTIRLAPAMPNGSGAVSLAGTAKSVPSAGEKLAELELLRRTEDIASVAKPAPQPAQPASAMVATKASAWAMGGTARRSFAAGGLSVGNYSDEIDNAGAFNTTTFDGITENDFLAVRDNPLSTFSVDVDTASYAIVRRFLNSNQVPPKGAVRTEELLNYFTYDYPQPQGDAPFSATMEVAACPWEPEHRLVRVGLKGREVPRDQRPPSNIVFLIDVSGSMNMPNKLPLLQEAFRLLIDQLGPKDRVAIVTYAGSTGILLNSTQDKEAMQAAVDGLRAHGSTNGASGVKLAYQVAERNFVKGGTNRVILATDGDWNVGITSQSDLLEMITQKAKSGVFLTVLGFGMDNLKDSMLVKLADRGNGHYAYIDTPLEAKKVFVEQLSGTLVTIAKDVKVQVEFNPARVGAYRLIGYEKRLLAKEDFNNDKKDAGEIGAGHTVTALYEVVPAGKEMPPLAMVDKLKYQSQPNLERGLEEAQRSGGDLRPEPAAASPSSPAPAKELEDKLAAPKKAETPAKPGNAPAPTTESAAPAPATMPELQTQTARPNDPNGPKPLAPESRPIPHAVPVEKPALDKPELLPPHAPEAAPRPVERAPRGGGAELLPPHKAAQGQPDVLATPVPAKPYLTENKSRKTFIIDDGKGHQIIMDAKNADGTTVADAASAAVLPASVRNEMLTLKLRYKAPDGDTSKLLEFPLTDGDVTWEKSSPDFRFAAAVAGYGMLLHDSTHRGQTTWDSVAEWASEGLGTDKSGYREEFLNLVKKAKVLAR